MGAKAIPHLMASLDETDEFMTFQSVGDQSTMIEIASVCDAARAIAVFDGTIARPKETQGPAKLLVTEQMDNLLGWYV